LIDGRVNRERLIYRLVEADDGTDLHGETGGWLSGR
jgi:hypothetical protein